GACMAGTSRSCMSITIRLDVSAAISIARASVRDGRRMRQKGLASSLNAPGRPRRIVRVAPAGAAWRV
ncbi:MAG: hypothetical protein AAGF76_05665, partial [Pseudomonadota bacterium]